MDIIEDIFSEASTISFRKPHEKLKILENFGQGLDKFESDKGYVLFEIQ